MQKYNPETGRPCMNDYLEINTIAHNWSIGYMIELLASIVSAFPVGKWT